MSTSTERAPLALRAGAPEVVEIPAVQGYHFRAMLPDDVATVFALVQAAEEADDVAARQSVEDVAELFDEPSWHAVTDSMLAVDHAGSVVAWATSLVFPGATQRVTAHLDGTVHPEHRRRGIGGALLTWQLARARHLLAAATEQYLPAVVSAQTGDRQHSRVALLERHGFTAQRWFHDMARDLSAPVPDVAPADGIALVRLDERLDLSLAARLVRNDAFSGHYGSQPWDEGFWQRQIVAHHSARLDLSLLALDASGAVVGALLSSMHPQDWPSPDQSELWIGSLGVLASHRGQGIAKALLVDVMRRSRDLAIVNVGLGVDADNSTGALRLYESVGFRSRRMEIAYEIHV